MNQKRTEIIHQRASLLVTQLVEAERKEFGGSKADALERLVLRGTISDKGLSLVDKHGSKDPQLAIFRDLDRKRAELGGGGQNLPGN